MLTTVFVVAPLMVVVLIVQFWLLAVILAGFWLYFGGGMTQPWVAFAATILVVAVWELVVVHPLARRWDVEEWV